MSDLIWLSQAQMRRIEPYFPLSMGFLGLMTAEYLVASSL
jgi:hypothetical protein